MARMGAIGRLALIALGALGVISASSLAQDEPSPETAPTPTPTPVIYGTSWGKTLAMDGTGFYNDFSRDIFERAGVGERYQVTPTKRAKNNFLRENTGCLYPSSIAVLTAGREITDADAFVETQYFLLVKSYLLAADGQTPYDGQMSLRGKRIAYPIGSPLPRVLASTGADFIPVSEEIDKARMLLSARVDYISGTMPDTAFVFMALGEPLPALDRGYELISTGVGVVCHRNPATIALVDRLNKAFDIARDSGALDRHFEGTGLNPATYVPAPTAAPETSTE